MSDKTFDIVVIGGGPGGYVAAIRAAQYGYKTAVVEGHKLGGECLNYGCIPSKALISATHLLDKVQDAERIGISCSDLKVDLKKMIDWKSSIVKRLTTGVGQLLKANKVTVFNGMASVKKVDQDGLKTISVNEGIDPYNMQKTSKSDVYELKAQNVILATGSQSVEIPNMACDGKRVLNSRQALDVTQIPKKIVVVGGGFIGLELGSCFAKLGTQITIVEASPELLPGTDRELVKVAENKLRKKGAEILLNARATGLKKSSQSALLKVVDEKGVEHNLEADWILMTVGRKPRTADLNLKTLGIELDDRKRIPVNNRLETSVKGLYAIGDIVSGPMLAHKASKEGLVAVEAIKNPKVTYDVLAMPWAIFVDPEIAGVGHTVESAKKAGWDPVVGKCPFAANGRALTTGESDGFVKIIADRKSDRLLGAQMVGPEVSNLIAEVASLIEMGATASDLATVVHAHPTLAETIMEAAESVHGKAIHIFSPKKTSAAARP